MDVVERGSSGNDEGWNFEPVEAYGGICEGDQREGRYSSLSGGDKAVEEDRSGAFTQGRAETATVP